MPEGTHEWLSDASVEAGRAALTVIREENDVERVKILSNLGGLLGTRFEHTGVTADLQAAIAYHRQAVDASPEPLHAARPGRWPVTTPSRFVTGQSATQC